MWPLTQSVGVDPATGPSAAEQPGRRGQNWNQCPFAAARIQVEWGWRARALPPPPGSTPQTCWIKGTGACPRAGVPWTALSTCPQTCCRGRRRRFADLGPDSQHGRGSNFLRLGKLGKLLRSLGSSGEKAAPMLPPGTRGLKSTLWLKTTLREGKGLQKVQAEPDYSLATAMEPSSNPTGVFGEKVSDKGLGPLLGRSPSLFLQGRPVVLGTGTLTHTWPEEHLSRNITGVTWEEGLGVEAGKSPGHACPFNDPGARNSRLFLSPPHFQPKPWTLAYGHGSQPSAWHTCPGSSCLH